MNMKSHILAAMREISDGWEDLLASLSEEQITAPMRPSHWTIKDVMAHLMAWQQRSIARAESCRLDREPVFPVWPAETVPDIDGDADQINAWIYETYNKRPWSEVHRLWREGFDRFLESSAQVSERDMLDGSRYPWLEGLPFAFFIIASYDHHQEHYEIVQHWLEEDAANRDSKSAGGS